MKKLDVHIIFFIFLLLWDELLNWLFTKGFVVTLEIGISYRRIYLLLFSFSLEFLNVSCLLKLLMMFLYAASAAALVNFSDAIYIKLYNFKAFQGLLINKIDDFNTFKTLKSTLKWFHQYRNKAQVKFSNWQSSII